MEHETLFDAPEDEPGSMLWLAVPSLNANQDSELPRAAPLIQHVPLQATSLISEGYERDHPSPAARSSQAQQHHFTHHGIMGCNYDPPGDPFENPSLGVLGNARAAEHSLGSGPPFSQLFSVGDVAAGNEFPNLSLSAVTFAADHFFQEISLLQDRGRPWEHTAAQTQVVSCPLLAPSASQNQQSTATMLQALPLSQPVQGHLSWSGGPSSFPHLGWGSVPVAAAPISSPKERAAVSIPLRGGPGNHHKRCPAPSSAHQAQTGPSPSRGNHALGCSLGTDQAVLQALAHRPRPHR
jgi:hypothetical protein